MDEGITLSRTLLPYIDQCDDFNFIDEDNNNIASRFGKTFS